MVLALKGDGVEVILIGFRADDIDSLMLAYLRMLLAIVLLVLS